MHPLMAALQLPFNLVPPTARVPVLLGPLRGARWIVGSGNHVCWLGVYEYRKQLLLSRMVAPGGVFYDVGAHVGFHTLLAARLVGTAGRVVAFEPLPRNLRFLREHVAMNHATNVQVVEAAVADRPGVEAFAENGSYMGGLAASGGLLVSTVAIDSLVATGALPPPAYVKLDVEGGEHRALQGMRQTLTRFRPGVVLATHSADLHRACLGFLAELGYAVRGVEGGDVWRTDEVVAQHPAAAIAVRR